MNPTVRAADLDDLAVIAALEEATFPRDAWSPGLVAEGVAKLLPTTRFRVAEHGGRVVGYVVVSIVDDVSELQRIAVRVAERRAGIGTALLADTLQLAAAGGATRTLLEVREDNAVGRAFYDAQGFTEIARRERYYRDGVAALIMELALKPAHD